MDACKHWLQLAHSGQVRERTSGLRAALHSCQVATASHVSSADRRRLLAELSLTVLSVLPVVSDASTDMMSSITEAKLSCPTEAGLLSEELSEVRDTSWQLLLLVAWDDTQVGLPEVACEALARLSTASDGLASPTDAGLTIGPHPEALGVRKFRDVGMLWLGE